jgi:hypothetical protein
MTLDFEATIQHLVELNNESVTEYNQIFDEYEVAAKHLNDVTSLFEKQGQVVDAAIKSKQKDEAIILQLRAQVRELSALDPKRLDKVNKEQKQRLMKQKAELEISERGRKKSDQEMRDLTSAIRRDGRAPFYHDPISGNTIRYVAGAFVSKGNDMQGIPESPVMEFFHSQRGITRQGFMDSTGDMTWCQASNSTPTALESQIALTEVLAFCAKHKVKLPKFSKAAA